MQYYRCQCGHRECYGSMPPAACDGCPDCGMNLATHPSRHHPPTPHSYAEHKVETDDGPRALTYCRFCHRTKANIEAEEAERAAAAAAPVEAGLETSDPPADVREVKQLSCEVCCSALDANESLVCAECGNTTCETCGDLTAGDDPSGDDDEWVCLDCADVREVVADVARQEVDLGDVDQARALQAGLETSDPGVQL